jgi:hypothetical protein
MRIFAFRRRGARLRRATTAHWRPMPARMPSWVAVGTAVTRRPPHRPVLALLTHTVPTSEKGMPRSIANPHMLPRHYSAPVFSGSVSSTGPCLGLPLADRLPSMPSAQRSPVFVRALRRYYAVARLPDRVHLGLIPHRLLRAARRLPRALPGSPGSRAWSFSACLGSSTPPGRSALAFSCTALLPSLQSDAVGSRMGLFRSSIPSLQIPLSNASSATLRPPSHGSGPEWIATPSPYDSLIRYSMPVLIPALSRLKVRSSRLCVCPTPRFSAFMSRLTGQSLELHTR